MLEGFVKLSVLKGGSFLSITNNGLNFNVNAVACMQDAKNVALLLNADKKQFAIQQCNESDIDKIPFYRDEKSLQTGVRLLNRKIPLKIAKMMNWDLENFSYRADGHYIDKEKAMIFELINARQFKKRKRRLFNG